MIPTIRSCARSGQSLMALSNYTELLDGSRFMQNRTGDTDFVTAVPSFVTLAHSRINRELRCRQMVKSATITLTDGVGDLPEDYLEFIGVRAGANRSRGSGAEF